MRPRTFVNEEFSVLSWGRFQRNCSSCPPPRSQSETRWERFAKEKGIAGIKRARMVWDEEMKEWRPRHGYKRANDGIMNHAIVEVKPVRRAICTRVRCWGGKYAFLVVGNTSCVVHQCALDAWISRVVAQQMSSVYFCAVPTRRQVI